MRVAGMFAIVTLLATMLCGCVSSEVRHEGKASAGETEKKIHINTPLSKDIRSDRIYVDFKDSPKLSFIVGQMLKSKGYRIVATRGEADVVFRMMGGIGITGGGKTAVGGQMEELVEGNTRKDADKTNYTDLGIHGDVIAVTSLLTKTLQVANIALWLSQETGIGGRVNETLVGDPRGVCVLNCENWNKRKHTATVLINTQSPEGELVKKGAWWIEAHHYYDKIEAEKHIAEALVISLEPFDDVPTTSPATSMPATSTTR